MVFFTLKRGAIIAEVLILLSLFLSWMRLSKFNARVFRWVIRAGLSSMVLLYSFQDKIPLILKRFNDISEDSGSGRGTFYALIFNRWVDADPLNFFFGFGTWTVPDFLGRVWINSVFAHSDWLEVVHDYGLFGIALYVFIILSIFSLCLRSWFLKDNSLYVFVSCFSLFIMKGLISGNIMFTENLYVVLPLAYAVTNIENKKKNNINGFSGPY